MAGFHRLPAAVARSLLRRIGPGLAVAFGCIAACLWTFGELADDVLEGEPFAFDEPLLRLARLAASPEADSLFLALSALGFAWGVVPADILLVLVLALRRRVRDALFAAVALGGSALLNILAKQGFRRERPRLWDSIAPESTFSFPSAHAMGSATLGCVLVLLARRRPWRGALVAAVSAFVVGVGVSRVYLGVHYPSDIVAGWAAAVAWAACAHMAVHRSRRPVRGA